MRRRLRVCAGLLATALAAAGCQGGDESDVDVDSTTTPAETGDGAGGDGDGRDGGGGGGAGDGGGGQGFTADGEPDVVATIATGLDTPWGIDFLPHGGAVVTERDTGRVLLVTAPEDGTGAGEVREAGTIPGVVAEGESGLLGVAVSPTYERDRLVYFYLTTAQDNRVVRARLAGDRLGEVRPVLTGIPNGFIHDGGGLAFGPDGYLYVTTGETGDAQLARDRSSYAGKILRIRTNGEAAPDNPFGDSPVYSWGHRNVEGLTWDEDGTLWATEFGQDRFDEVNRILPGEDYGWPVVEGEGGPAQFAQPAITWTTDEASPAGIAYASGFLWVATLRGERLWRVRVTGTELGDARPYFEGEYGRLRAIARDPDGRLWLATSNQDGRGEPAPDDDRILLIEP